VKVVEGSEIYNFPIHTLVHFSCKKIEFLSLEQGQSETISGQRDVARAPASQSARARRTPPRRPSPLAPSRGSFPEATHVPRPPRSLPLLAPRVGRRTPDGPPDGPAFPLPGTLAEAGACS
jgi:hypothetical protein